MKQGRFLIVAVIALAISLTLYAFGKNQGNVMNVIPTDGYLKTAVAGLERTHATAEIVSVQGETFAQALRVAVKDSADETNATQLTVMNSGAVKAGDVMMASLWLRGSSLTGGPGRVEFLFEKATSPWTKSATQGIGTSGARAWKHVSIAFQAAEGYQPGEAMASIRLALQPQTIEIGAFAVLNYGQSKTLEELQQQAVAESPLGTVQASVDFAKPKQTLMGMGGNFCQPRYGSTEAMDSVGKYVLDNLEVVHARIGLPLNNWTPDPGVYKDDAQAKASLEALQMMAQKKIPVVVSVWEGPQWLLPGEGEGSRVMPPAKYAACAEAIGRYLLLADSKYGCNVEYFSFNEPDYGVNFKFTSQTMIDFIKVAGPMWERMGVKTKFVVGDTAGGSSSVNYDTPILEEKSIAKYLGPIAFHCWDALGAADSAYTGIAALGKKYNKPVWCLEAGHDAQLWQAKDPWGTWSNGIRTAMAYVRTLNLTDSAVVDYWTYEDNYPIVDKDQKPYPVFSVIKQMQGVLNRNSVAVTSTSTSTDLQIFATRGPRPSERAILLVNAAGKGEVVLSGLSGEYKLIVSTADEQAKASGVAKASADGKMTVSMPSRSVVTLIQN
ncbi:hypothetical protein BH11ARM1_BH11ARM1_00220 [soil metagenome]